MHAGPVTSRRGERSMARRRPRWHATAVIAAVVLTAAAAACGPGRAADRPLRIPEIPEDMQAVSLLGDTLRLPALDSAVRSEREAQLADARAAYEAAPDDPDPLIWYGRRLAYLGRYREAITVFSRGIEEFPDDARMYRHRGHRYITVRQLDRGMADLLRATQLTADRPDQIEPDGQPNAAGTPTSTLNSNIWYHLGLAHYLRGDFARAASAYRECLKYAPGADMTVAASHWLYMALRRNGDDAEAAAVLTPIRPDLAIYENQSYHRLLLMYAGVVDPESVLSEVRGAGALDHATLGYGLANWYLYHGDRERADTLFAQILAGTEWAAFGFIAAEADVARWRPADRPAQTGRGP
jgi:tetratricopeptide (TPR) repeat protein